MPETVCFRIRYHVLCAPRELSSYARVGPTLDKRYGQRREARMRVLSNLRLARVAYIGKDARRHQRQGGVSGHRLGYLERHSYLDFAQGRGRRYSRRLATVCRRPEMTGESGGDWQLPQVDGVARRCGNRVFALWPLSCCDGLGAPHPDVDTVA